MRFASMSSIPRNSDFPDHFAHFTSIILVMVVLERPKIRFSLDFLGVEALNAILSLGTNTSEVGTKFCGNARSCASSFDDCEHQWRELSTKRQTQGWSPRSNEGGQTLACGGVSQVGTLLEKTHFTSNSLSFAAAVP